MAYIQYGYIDDNIDESDFPSYGIYILNACSLYKEAIITFPYGLRLISKSHCPAAFLHRIFCSCNFVTPVSARCFNKAHQI